ncbi:uncharacterized protein TRAVEDRAFT_57830 [Trametes versicolor FP-101664 SS1]|uniref:uncharacterized protein n=1 Tax=Trametes versicolor (strain FP-101664) TaxID=717944 RepID=UPI00046218C2|nr:uncharacterized protein TRAVEDRAFT_57830 [Trametes versicolor FP-101664 SS1]EIW60652.1 hypothetical protein TRAVEDRAFT_57830 [Trametes versicolor FP-101664 SS1]
MGPPQPAPQSAMPSQSDSQVVLSPPVPAPLAATLRSNQLGADVTGKTNIPALRHDMLELTHHLDRLTRTHATDRAAIRDALLKLTMAVDDLRNDASPATSPTVAFRDLEQRVHRLAQGLEREEDTRAREIGVMDVRLGSVEDDTRDISRSVTTVSQELAGAISALSQIRATLSTITQQVGDLSNNARALVAAPAPTRETALTPSTPHESRRRERQVSPSPAPTQAFQRRLPRPPQPIPTDGHGAEGRPPKRARGNGQRGQHQPQLAPVPAPLPAPVAGPASFTVRFGAVGWSADPASLRAEVLSTGHLAWNAIPNVFESVMDIRRDPVDSRFALLRFPTRYLASTFVEAWVQHGHREQSLRTVHAVIL